MLNTIMEKKLFHHIIFIYFFIGNYIILGDFKEHNYNHKSYDAECCIKVILHTVVTLILLIKMKPF